MHVVGGREKLFGCVEIICRLMYGPGLLVSLIQTPSVSGRILWRTVSEGRSMSVPQEEFESGCRDLVDVTDQHTLVSILPS